VYSPLTLFQMCKTDVNTKQRSSCCHSTARPSCPSHYGSLHTRLSRIEYLACWRRVDCITTLCGSLTTWQAAKLHLPPLIRWLLILNDDLALQPSTRLLGFQTKSRPFNRYITSSSLKPHSVLSENNFVKSLNDSSVGKNYLYCWTPGLKLLF